jgi:hypothetical protein
VSPLQTEAECTPNRQCRDSCTEPHRWYDTGDGVGSLKYWCKGTAKDAALARAKSEPMVTIRLPLANWNQIVSDIENMCGTSAENIEILQDTETLAAELPPEEKT